MKTPRVFRTLIFISLLACLPALADEKRDKFDAQFRQAQALFKEDKLAEAYTAVQAAARLDPSRYEASGFAALVLLKGGKIAAAREALADARKLAPADAKKKLDDIGKLIETAATTATSAGATNSPGDITAPASGNGALTGAARRKYDTLLVIVEEADQAKSAAERSKLLNEFMEKSSEFVREAPEFMQTWVLRAAAALELNQSKTAWEAGQQMIKLGADLSDDAKVRKIMATLGRKGWLGKEAPAGGLETATKDKPFENSLGMKFVPVSGTAVLFSVFETRKGDYALFARANSGVDDLWRNPAYQNVAVSSGDDHPVVNVSWNEAKQFCDWLTSKEQAEGKIPRSAFYRLPADEEWSHAVGIGDREGGGSPKDKDEKIPAVFPWGTQFPPPNGAGNYADSATKARFTGFTVIEGYRDGFATTAPVGSFAANGSGLHDLGGNVWEWCEDKFSSDKEERVLRGGSLLHNDPRTLLSSYRLSDAPGFRDVNIGFRVVLVGVSARKVSPAVRRDVARETVLRHQCQEG